MHKDKGVVKEHHALDESVVDEAKNLLFGEDSAVVDLLAKVSRFETGWQLKVAPCAFKELSDKLFEVFDHKCESLEEQVEVDCINSYFEESSVAREDVAKGLLDHL